jgi:hypothetical protein
MIPNPIVKINGITVHDPRQGIYSITGYRCHTTFMTAAGTFEIDFTDLDRNRIFPNDRIQIILDDTSIIKGIVDTTEETISNDSVLLKATGRDYAGWWLSSDAEPHTYNNMSDNEIIIDMLQQGVEQLGYGLPVLYNLGTPNIIPQYIVGTGKSFYDCWGELANINNLYMHFDNDGVLNKMYLADKGDPVAFFDLDNFYEGTATITRSIADAKSDVWIQGRVGTSSGSSKDSLGSLLSSNSSPSNLTDLLNGKKSARKSSATFLVKQQRPDKLHTDNRFRIEGRTFEFNPNRDGSTFRRRVVMAQQKRLKTEQQKEMDLQFAKTAPVFDVKLTLNKLYNIVVNQIVRVKYKDMDTNMVVCEVDYDDSINGQQTTLSLKLPGRIR